jgi:hypothetical protein
MDPALGMEKGAPTSKIYENSFLHSPEFVTRAASPFKGLGLGRVSAAAANGQVQRGGMSEKKVATKDPWFHSDVVETRLLLIAAFRERHAKK